MGGFFCHNSLYVAAISGMVVKKKKKNVILSLGYVPELKLCRETDGEFFFFRPMFCLIAPDLFDFSEPFLLIHPQP